VEQVNSTHDELRKLEDALNLLNSSSDFKDVQKRLNEKRQQIANLELDLQTLNESIASDTEQVERHEKNAKSIARASNLDGDKVEEMFDREDAEIDRIKTRIAESKQKAASVKAQIADRKSEAQELSNQLIGYEGDRIESED